MCYTIEVIAEQGGDGMKLAVISDIHSNYIALEAALISVRREKPDGIVFLGDYVSDCPYPQKTMEQLYAVKEEYPCYFIRGNREDYLLAHRRNPEGDGWMRSSSSGSLLYTYENLTERDLDFFASMPECMDITLPGCPVLTVCHASPAKTKEWIYGHASQLEHYSSTIAGELLLCGHTHKTGFYQAKNDKRVIFCPSVGLPQDEKSHARITYLDLIAGKWVPRMLPLHVDNDAVIAGFSESGLLDAADIWAKCIIRAIREERDYAAQCVTLAWHMATADHYHGNGVLPEEYWQAAAKKLGVI